MWFDTRLHSADSPSRSEHLCRTLQPAAQDTYAPHLRADPPAADAHAARLGGRDLATADVGLAQHLACLLLKPPAGVACRTPSGSSAVEGTAAPQQLPQARAPEECPRDDASGMQQHEVSTRAAKLTAVGGLVKARQNVQMEAGHAGGTHWLTARTSARSCRKKSCSASVRSSAAGSWFSSFFSCRQELVWVSVQGIQMARGSTHGLRRVNMMAGTAAARRSNSYHAQRLILKARDSHKQGAPACIE